MKEMTKTIKQMKNNKSGRDEIPNEIFTNADPKVKDLYLQTINKIIQHTQNTNPMANRRNNKNMQREKGKMLK